MWICDFYVAFCFSWTGMLSESVNMTLSFTNNKVIGRVLHHHLSYIEKMIWILWTMQEPRITLIILKLFEERILECARLLVLFIDLYDFFNHNQGFLAPPKRKTTTNQGQYDSDTSMLFSNTICKGKRRQIRKSIEIFWQLLLSFLCYFL